MRLICLPYAGGSAATYISWARSLPAEVELIALQPPGRGSRMAEMPHAQCAVLLQLCALSAQPQTTTRFRRSIKMLSAAPLCQ
jgi:surfactin synthase thioesterase subunit